ncbi:ATP-dependent DNA helicase [Trichothermofontia sp.]
MFGNLVSVRSLLWSRCGHQATLSVIEADVHQQLHAFLRAQGDTQWPHHLTVARLVARALRLGGNALLQAGAPAGDHGHYRISYLASALIWPGPVILVTPLETQQRLLQVEIPRLQAWLGLSKAIWQGDRWPQANFEGLLITTPDAWLADRLFDTDAFPPQIPTIIDGIDDLETWTRQQLQADLDPVDWRSLTLAYPAAGDRIRDTQAQLTHRLFQHPANPYECYLLDGEEQLLLQDLYWDLQQVGSDYHRQLIALDHSLPSPLPVLPDLVHVTTSLPSAWQRFWHQLQHPHTMAWVTIHRAQGQFSLHCAPIQVAEALAPVWPQQPLILISGAIDLEPEAATYCQRLGLPEMTTVKFSPDRQREQIDLYLPEGLPTPNTREFQPALLHELRKLLTLQATTQGIAVLLIGDLPLKAQIGSQLAAEFGSRVQVEKTCLESNGILVTGWEFWRQQQRVLPAPQLMAIATLPIPSLEHPLVAARVADYKRQRQDWFRMYLLPTALADLQWAITPMRTSQGIVALLDSRVVRRTYGQQVLTALSPFARINYLAPDLFLPDGDRSHWPSD